LFRITFPATRVTKTSAPLRESSTVVSAPVKEGTLKVTAARYHVASGSFPLL
jgi:hypothetical protein